MKKFIQSKNFILLFLYEVGRWPELRLNSQWAQPILRSQHRYVVTSKAAND
jgi:hypothetical protein